MMPTLQFYIWNIGFQALFTKYTSAGIQFPLSQMMEIELGLIGAFFLMGCAVQLRVLRILQFKLKEITRESKRREDELEAQATGRYKETEAELALWEKQHGRMDSRISSLPLMKDQETNSPGTEETSQFSLHGERRPRYTSGVSDFMAAPPQDDRRQSLGALPAMDLGLDIESDIPQDFVDKDLLTRKDNMDNRGTSSTGRTLNSKSTGDFKKKEDLLAEIASIRKSIEVLRTETPGGSSAGSEPSRSRHQSFISRRTMSIGFAEALDGPSRPPRSQNPRERATSMDRLSRTPSQLFLGGDSISRPSSAPPQEDKEEEWNNYVRERKLFQPPGGASAPINRTSGLFQPAAQRAVPVPPSVAEALARRQQQEVALESGELSPLADLSNDRSRHMRSLSYSSDEMLREDRRRRDSNQLNKSNSPTGASRPPITILPPRRPDAAAEKKEPVQRTYTYEELAERHREKMRNLQEPLSRAEQERAKLEDARNRWSRSQEVERREMAKREERRSRQLAEREKRNSGSPEEGKRSSKRASQLLPGVGGGKIDDAGLNADRLGKLPSQGTSKRQSVLKVEDWRRYQQDVESGLASSSPQQQSNKRLSNVPFPAPAAVAPRQERRRSSQLFTGSTPK